MSSSVPGVWSVEVVEAEARAVWLVAQCKERPAPELVGRWVAYVSPPGGGARLRAGEPREELVDAVVSACRGALSVRVPSSIGGAVSRALGSATEVVVDASLDLAAAARAALVRVEASARAGDARDLGAEPGALTSLARSLELYDRGLAPWSTGPGRSTPFVVALDSASRFPNHLVSLFATRADRRVAQIHRRSRVAGHSPRAVLEWSDGPAPFDCTGCVVRVERGTTSRAYVIGGHAVTRPLVSCEVDWVEGVVTALGEMALEVLAEVLSLDDRRGPTAIRER
ncbi:MAG: hypothetical protein U0183_14290 [Polyangiaceae bacterium]